MSNIPVQNKLDAVHEGAQSVLRNLIAAKTKMPPQQQVTDTPDALWSSAWWGFEHCATFKQLPPSIQHEIVTVCNRELLNESYFIEKSGLAYCAKMILLAENTDTAQLYALIAADEASHLAWIEPHVQSQDKTRPVGPFLSFLSTLVEELSPTILVFLVQIILEGWGLDHYRRLADGCNSAQLACVFRSILKDEALHHQSGRVMFDASRLASPDLEVIADALKYYVAMVRVGPQLAVAIADRQSGGLSLREIEDVFVALRHSEETDRKLKLLKTLMRQKGTEPIVDGLEEGGYFVPMTTGEAALAYVAVR